MKRETVKRTGKIVMDTVETVKRPGETGTEDRRPTEGAKEENRTLDESGKRKTASRDRTHILQS